MNPVKLWKIVAAFVLVFLAGTAVGAVGTMLQTRRAFERGLNHETWITDTMERLDREVKLTPEQRLKIHGVVEARARQVKTNLVQMATDTVLLIDHLGDEIDQELTSEQRTIHGRMREEFRQKMREALHMEFKGSGTNAPAAATSAGRYAP